MTALLKPLHLMLIATALLALTVLVSGTPSWVPSWIPDSARAADAADRGRSGNATGPLGRTTPRLATLDAFAPAPHPAADDLPGTLTQDLPILAVLLLGIGGLLWVRRHTFLL